jgi:hypothetical protein
MSFKVKRWATYREVDMTDFIPGCSSSAGMANPTLSYKIPHAGKILILAYTDEGDPLWTVYDPETDTTGTVYYPDNIGTWNWYSYFEGWNKAYIKWSKDLILCVSMSQALHMGGEWFYGWDSSFNFYQPDFLVSPRTNVRVSCSGPGTADGVTPNILSYQWKQGSPSTDYAIVRTTLAGSSVVYSGDDIYIGTEQGVPYYGMREFGGYYSWWRDYAVVLYGGVPTDTTQGNYLASGQFGGGWNNEAIHNRTWVRSPDSGLVYSKNTLTGGDPYWSLATSPLVDTYDDPDSWPDWDSAWDFRLLEDGSYTLNENDLDGYSHGTLGTTQGVQGCPPTFNNNLGWYVGVEEYQNGASFDVYALNPFQPSGILVPDTQMPSDPAGWVGEFAVRNDLILEHVLPFPDERDPDGDVMPPEIRVDGTLIGSKEIYQKKGQDFDYVKDVTIDISSYPTSDPDWWWPGNDDNDYVEGFWWLFGGSPMVLGAMPDYMWGVLNPLGTNVMYGLGVATEQLGSEHPFKITNGQKVSGTNWCHPDGSYMMLRGFADGRMSFAGYKINSGSEPSWVGQVGRIDGTSWEPEIDFSEIGYPDLGCDGWTVRSVESIPACRSLPLGGWLVGATLYFAAWSVWEWTPGSRDLQFIYKDGTETGNGWVPALPGNIGPLPIDYHEPELLAAYDEWTFNRSLYGPDALLVYDHDGNFVDCLNDMTLHPPDGRNLFVIPDTVPKIVYRVYRHGTYSDYAEGWGMWHKRTDDYEVQEPLFVCYDLEDKSGNINPGAGTYRGFVNMHRAGDYNLKDNTWRWAVPGSFDNWDYPKSVWSPPGSRMVRAGRSGRGITPLTPLGGSDKMGVKGPGARV